jgi:hypothetical protein
MGIFCGVELQVFEPREQWLQRAFERPLATSGGVAGNKNGRFGRPKIFWVDQFLSDPIEHP